MDVLNRVGRIIGTTSINEVRGISIRVGLISDNGLGLAEYEFKYTLINGAIGLKAKSLKQAKTLPNFVEL